MKTNKKRMIKVCFFSPFGYSLYDNKSDVLFGGAETQMYILSKFLAKDPNYLIFVISGEYKLKSRKIITINKITIHLTQDLDKKIINFIIRPLNLLLALIKIKPDIIIDRGAGIGTFICAIFSRIYNKKFIYSIASEIDVNGYAEKGFLGKFFKFGLKMATWIIAQNKEQIIELEERKRKSFSNISMIKNGFEINKFIKKRKEYALWVGKAADFKQPEILLEIAVKLPELNFVMICPKYKDNNYWNKIYQESKLIPNLKFYEFIPFKDIQYFFDNAFILINTSKYEGFPNTFIQALKSKTPIVSLNINPDNFLITHNCGFYSNNKIELLIQFIRDLINDNILYKRISDNCYNYVIEYHNINNIIKKWKKIIFHLNDNKK